MVWCVACYRSLNRLDISHLSVFVLKLTAFRKQNILFWCSKVRRHVIVVLVEMDLECRKMVASVWNDGITRITTFFYFYI